MKTFLRLILGDTLMTRLDMKINEVNKNQRTSILKTFILKYIELVKKLDGLGIFLLIVTLSNIFILNGLLSFVIIALLDLIAIRVTLNSK